MTHIICGYPSFKENMEILEIMDEAAVEYVEMQFPFSEPVADGPLFAQANQISIENGTTLEQCFELIQTASKKFRFKILMMGYYNTVFKYGEEAFCKTLAKAGAMGMIIPDIPPEEAASLRAYAMASDLQFVQLTAPTSSPERLEYLCKLANESKSMVYAVARKGVTGVHTAFSKDTIQYLDFIKSRLEVPLAVGFGISEKSDLNILAGHADTGVIGTAVLKTWESSGAQGLKDFFKSLK
jgi:tryptophan synthase alpha chain